MTVWSSQVEVLEIFEALSEVTEQLEVLRGSVFNLSSIHFDEFCGHRPKIDFVDYMTRLNVMCGR